MEGTNVNRASQIPPLAKEGVRGGSVNHNAELFWRLIEPPLTPPLPRRGIAHKSSSLLSDCRRGVSPRVEINRKTRGETPRLQTDRSRIRFVVQSLIQLLNWKTGRWGLESFMWVDRSLGASGPAGGHPTSLAPCRCLFPARPAGSARPALVLGFGQTS